MTGTRPVLRVTLLTVFAVLMAWNAAGQIIVPDRLQGGERMAAAPNWSATSNSHSDSCSNQFSKTQPPRLTLKSHGAKGSVQRTNEVAVPGGDWGLAGAPLR